MFLAKEGCWTGDFPPKEIQLDRTEAVNLGAYRFATELATLEVATVDDFATNSFDALNRKATLR